MRARGELSPVDRKAASFDASKTGFVDLPRRGAGDVVIAVSHHGFMVILTPELEHKDFLQALAAHRRELHITIRTDRPLRKADNRHQRARLRGLRRAARKQVEAQLASGPRKAFRDRVAMHLQLAVPDDTQSPSLPTMVKEYVDLIAGVALPDDALIEDLTVSVRRESRTDAMASVKLWPLSIFTSEFDRAFRVGQSESNASRGQEREPWGLLPFDAEERQILRHDEDLVELIRSLDVEEAEAYERDPDEFVDLDVPSGYEELRDPSVRERVRVHLEDSCERRRGRLFTDNAIDVRDRGGRAPEWLGTVANEDLADVVGAPANPPGSIHVPSPPVRSGEMNWDREVRKAWAGCRDVWRSVQLDGPVALDIALVGGAAQNSDLDNVAGRIIRHFEAVFAAIEISGFRIYRRSEGEPLIRSRVLPLSRLDELFCTIDAARHPATTATSSASNRRGQFVTREPRFQPSNPVSEHNAFRQ